MFSKNGGLFFRKESIFDAKLTIFAGLLAFGLRQFYIALQGPVAMLGCYLSWTICNQFGITQDDVGELQGGRISSTQAVIIWASVFQTYQHILRLLGGRKRLRIHDCSSGVVLWGYLEQADASKVSVAVNPSHDPKYDSQEVKIKVTAVERSIWTFLFVRICDFTLNI